MSNLQKRILSAAILGPIAIYLIFLGGIPYQIMISLAGGLMFLEWQRMIVFLKDWRPWGVFGLFYIALPCAALVAIRNLDEGGLGMILWILCVVWSTDIGAYFTGKTLGGPKLMPKVSPNKTWSGAIGGMVAAALVSTLYLWLSDGPALLVHATLAAFFSVVSQAGDLFESWMKRKCGVKDSGNTIPGHGGVLDRLDGILFVAPVAWLMLHFFMAN